MVLQLWKVVEREHFHPNEVMLAWDFPKSLAKVHTNKGNEKVPELENVIFYFA